MQEIRRRKPHPFVFCQEFPACEKNVSFQIYELKFKDKWYILE